MAWSPAVLGLMFAAAAAGEWLRLESPDFELYTAAGARTGRDILARLEQARHVFATSVPGRASALPVRVFVFRSAADFAPYNVRAGAAGYFAPGPDRDIIAMQAGASDLHRVVLHEFVHLLMRNTDWAVPAWLNEGTAELFSTLRWSGARLTAGEAVPSRVAALRSQPLLDIRTLLAVDGHSPHYNETEKAGIFYAQSWALVHMLNFSPKYRDKTPQFMKHIASGIPAHDAFSSAYRLPLAIIGEDLRAYVRSGRFAGQSFEIPPAPTTEDVRVSAVSDVQAALLSIDLLVDIGRAAEAEAMLTRLAARHGSRADVQQALGDAAARRREFTVAGEHYRRARAMGSRTGRLLYDMALVQRELGADDASLQDALAEALALDPTLFDAHFLLGHIKLKSARCREAAALFQSASELRPARGDVWENLALAHHACGNKTQAAAAARKARSLAATVQETQRADATVRLVASEAAPREPSLPAPAATTPPVARVEGTLTQVDCIDNRARLHISWREGRLFLLVADPSRVVLSGAGAVTAELACGTAAQRVIVEYRAAPDTSWGTAGIVTAVRFL